MPLSASESNPNNASLPNGSYALVVRIHEDGEQIVDAHLPNYPEGARFPD